MKNKRISLGDLKKLANRDGFYSGDFSCIGKWKESNIDIRQSVK